MMIYRYIVASLVYIDHILTLHMYITCYNWEITFFSLFLYYPGRKTHNYEDITITNILLLVTTVVLVCVRWQIHCTISSLLCNAFVLQPQAFRFIYQSMLHACNYYITPYAITPVSPRMPL